MNLSRMSKKSPHADNRQTLAALHEQKLREFEEDYQTLPKKEETLRQLIEQYKRKESDNLRNLYEEIGKLQQAVRKLRNREEETSYLIDASEYLKQYYAEKPIEQSAEPYAFGKVNNITNFINKEKGAQKGKICKEYIDRCLTTVYCKSHSDYLKEELTKLICHKCNAMRTIIHNEAVASCEVCGDQIAYQDIYQHQEHREEVEVLSPFALILLARQSKL